MQVMLMRLMSKGEYLIVPKGTKFTGSGKLGLRPRAQIALEKVGSFQYLMFYRILGKPDLALKKQTNKQNKNKKKEKRELNFLISGAQMGLDIFSLF